MLSSPRMTLASQHKARLSTIRFRRFATAVPESKFQFVGSSPESAPKKEEGVFK